MNTNSPPCAPALAARKLTSSVRFLLGTSLIAAVLLLPSGVCQAQESKNTTNWHVALITPLKESLPLGEAMELSYGCLEQTTQKFSPPDSQIDLYSLMEGGNSEPKLVASGHPNGAWSNFTFTAKLQSSLRFFAVCQGTSSELSEKVTIGPPMPAPFISGMNENGETPLLGWNEAQMYCASLGGELPSSEQLQHVAGQIDANTQTNSLGWKKGWYWSRDEYAYGQYTAISLKNGDQVPYKSKETNHSVCVSR